MADRRIVAGQHSSYKFASQGHSSFGEVPEMNLERVYPRQLSTGVTRGTQMVGYGNAKIDGSNNRITVGTPDGGTIGMGAIPNTTPEEFGFFTLNSQGKLTYKLVDGIAYYYDDNGNLAQIVRGGTTYVYDPDSALNVVQMGILPDGSGGIAGSNEGFSVDQGF